jgi:Flp pilus assembly pilin Flp
MKAIMKKLLRDQQGTSAIEMGLICSLIILAMMTALNNFAGESQLTWNTISSKTKDAISGAVS